MAITEKRRSMEMVKSEYELTGASIVVLADTFNPSIASKDWLVQKGVIKEGISNFIHMPLTSIVETPTLSLFVDMAKLQITINTPRKSQLQKLVTTSKTYIEALPETPFKAVGLNFSFSLKDKSCLKEDFLPRKGPLEKMFGTTLERGAILVFPFSVFRVTLTFKPAGETGINLGFNFHRDVTGSDHVISTIRHHTQCFEKAEEIMGGMLNG